MEICMVDLWKEVFSVFLLYIADGWHFITFAGLFVFLWITEKNKNIRVILLYITAAVLFMFFFPVTIYISFRIMGETATYYRILWFAPMTIIIAYGIVKLVSSRKERVTKVIVSIIAVMVLMTGGDYVYDNEFFQTTKNLYQLPPTVIAICDEIEVDGREVTAVFPKELMEYVRQYSATVFMPYGREMLVEHWGFYDELYDVMNGEYIAPELLATLAREKNCNYIILQENKIKVEDMEAYDYIWYRTIGGYYIFKDKTAYLGLDVNYKEKEVILQ
jgi:hypothetical protein